jgi:hypothetical protein
MELIKLDNTERFDAAFFSEPLTAYAQNYMIEGPTQSIMEKVAGKVYVPRRFEYRRYSSAAELANVDIMATNEEAIRALGSDFKTLSKSRDIQMDKTYNKGFVIRLDEDEMSSDPQWEVNCVKKILRALTIADAFQISSLLYNDLSAYSVTPTWNGGAGQDPDGDLMAMLAEAENACNLRPNYILMGANLWAARIKTLRAQTSLLAVQSANQSVKDLSDWLQAEVIVTNRADFPGTQSALFMGYSGSSGLDDIATVRRFVTAAEGGVDYRSFKRQVSTKIWEVAVEHYSNIVTTGPTLGLRTVPDTNPPTPTP